MPPKRSREKSMFDFFEVNKKFQHLTEHIPRSMPLPTTDNWEQEAHFLKLCFRHFKQEDVQPFFDRLKQYIIADNDDPGDDLGPDSDVEVSSRENCNAVLFVLQTFHPMKIYLRCDTNTSKLTFATVKKLCYESNYEYKLSRGSAQLCKPSDDSYSNFSVFLYHFTNTITCSSAESSNLPRLTPSSSQLNMHIHDPKRLKYGASFFFPEKTEQIEYTPLNTTAPACEIFKFGTKFPVVAEADRTDAMFLQLGRNLSEKKISVKRYHTPGDVSKSTQFTGGGDIQILGKASSSSICITCKTVTYEDSDGSMSPQEDGQAYTLTVMEHKNNTDDLSKVTTQLQANMIVAIGNTLQSAIHDNGFCKEDIINVKILTSYGILCGATGSFGALKLNVNFEENRMDFTTCYPFGVYERSVTTLLIDSALDCFITKIDTQV